MTPIQAGSISGGFHDPASIGRVGLGMMVFNFMYFGFEFLHMGTTGLVAQIYGTGQDTAIGHLLVHGVSVALVLGECLFWPHRWVPVQQLQYFRQAIWPKH